jgi:zinc transporter ZupT
MLRTWFLTLASVALVSAIPLAGLSLIRLDRARVERLLLALISLAVGALLGGAFLHLMPEALDRSGASRTLFGWFLVGFMGFFLLEKLLAAPGRGDRRSRPWRRARGWSSAYAGSSIRIRSPPAAPRSPAIRPW